MYLLHILKTRDLPRTIPRRATFWKHLLDNHLPLRLYCRIPKKPYPRDENTVVILEFPYEYTDTFLLQHACSKIMQTFLTIGFAITEDLLEEEASRSL